MNNAYNLARDLIRRIEFNKTEPETLSKLMEQAVEKGAAEREELRRLHKEAQKLSPLCQELNLIRKESLGSPPEEILECLVGIDGSHQLMGGAGGTWYIFASAAQVVFHRGLKCVPDVICDADIQRIQEHDFEQISSTANLLLASVETKAIASWAGHQIPSIVMIDGPIAEPPSCRDKQYIGDRCSAIRACLNQQIPVMGFVKRSVDTQFVQHCVRTSEVQRPEVSECFKRFTTDAYLLSHLMTLLAYTSKESEAYLVSTALDVSKSTKVFELYLENGIRIIMCYLMLSAGSPLLRMELAVLADAELTTEEIQSSAKRTLDIAVHTIYPGHQIPLPVQIAHEKCNIRQGCAETLYYEIMTAQLATDPVNQILLTKLR